MASALNDDSLVALYQRARRYTLAQAIENAATEIVGRPSVLDRQGVGRFAPYGDLANLALGRGDKAEMYSWIEKGRAADPAGKTTDAPRWELLDIRMRSRCETPESWVPMLAVALDRYKDDTRIAQMVLSNLVEMGLVRMQPHPEKPDQVMIDSRMLQAVLAEYGPRITTSSGQLGVSAAQGGIWTPGSPGAGTTTQGGIWTPGGASAPAASGDKPKLIIPGR